MKLRVFIADDNPELLQKIAQHYETKGYDVITAANGKDALHLLNVNNVPHLIIIDADMPELDGLETCRKIKSDNRLNRCPIILLKEDWVDEKPFRQIGVEEFLMKPLNLDALIKMSSVLLTYGTRPKIPQKSKGLNKEIIAIIIIVIAILGITIILIGTDNLFLRMNK